MTQEKIDIVVLWVDGSDPNFIKEKQRVTSQKESLNVDADGEQRYREYGIFSIGFV